MEAERTDIDAAIERLKIASETNRPFIVLTAEADTNYIFISDPRDMPEMHEAVTRLACELAVISGDALPTTDNQIINLLEEVTDAPDNGPN